MSQHSCTVDRKQVATEACYLQNTYFVCILPSEPYTRSWERAIRGSVCACVYVCVRVRVRVFLCTYVFRRLRAHGPGEVQAVEAKRLGKGVREAERWERAYRYKGRYGVYDLVSRR